MCILSLDLSTSITGLAIFKDYNLVHAESIHLEADETIPEDIRFITKGNQIKERFEYLKTMFDIQEIVVEEPLQNSKNRKTVNLLVGFNTLCTYLAYQTFNSVPEYISVRQWATLFMPEFTRFEKGKLIFYIPKEIDKKEYILKKVKKIYPNIFFKMLKSGNYVKGSYDKSDAIAVGVSYMVKKKYIPLNTVVI